MPDVVMEDLGLEDLVRAHEEARRARAEATKAMFYARQEIVRRAADRAAKVLLTGAYEVTVDQPTTYAWNDERFIELCRRSNVNPEEVMTYEPPRPERWKTNTTKALALGRKLGLGFAAELESCYDKIPGEPTISVKEKPNV